MLSRQKDPHNSDWPRIIQKMLGMGQSRTTKGANQQSNNKGWRQPPQGPAQHEKYLGESLHLGMVALDEYDSVINLKLSMLILSVWGETIILAWVRD